MEHEYTVQGGRSRTSVGRYLSILAAGISAALVFILFWFVDLAKALGLPASVPSSILSLIGAGAVFTALYWLLDRRAWRWKAVAFALKVPDLSGKWECRGETLDTSGAVMKEWSGSVTIVQSWDRLRVRLRTERSGSNSDSAAIINDEADGYRLFYSYKNDPKIGETELTAHRGAHVFAFGNSASADRRIDR